ncbi:MAG: D-sedoheptulose-7-phosphate isomerase [Chloroflexota bacterium]
MALEIDWSRDRIRVHLIESAKVMLQAADKCADAILAAAHLISDSFQNGGKLMICGNGGSAAESQHLAAEFVSRLTGEFQRPGLPAIALTTDTSIITAHANDYSFDEIFERQVQVLGSAGDVLMGLSTSGGSENILRAFKAARAMEIRTVALVGSARGGIAAAADVAIRIPSRNNQYIQEAHLAVEHLVCDLVERYLFGEKGQRAAGEAVRQKRPAQRRTGLKRAG